MEKWYEITMNSPELRDEFISMIHEDDENDRISEPVRRKLEVRVRNSWVKKDKHRKDMKRRFLSLNPGMEKENLRPLPSTSCIDSCDVSIKQGEYFINHVSHIYYTIRGHFEVFAPMDIGVL